MSLPFAVALAGAVSWLGWHTRSLTRSGAFAAALVGAAVLYRAGWAGAAALGAFFAGSTAVSRATERRQPVWVDAKGNRRDAWQVLANGGVAAAAALVGPRWLADGSVWVVIATLAAAAADTWATSLGTLSAKDPVDLIRWRRVPAGTSGGVSLIGTLGAIAGAVTVAGSAALAGAPPGWLLPAVAVGVAGMVADSGLGATVQGKFACPSCGVASERRRHRCGTATRHVGGIRWLGNDGVNLAATAFAALLGWVSWEAWLSP